MGINYLKQYKDGSVVATADKPVFGEISTTSDYYIGGLWYDKTGVLYPTQFTYANQDGKLLGVEVANGQPVDLHLTEDAPSLVEKCIKSDVVISDEYKGKNACTAWVNFDGTTTPPTIRDSFNVSQVVRTATGVFEVYFTNPMDNINYVVSGMSGSRESLPTDGIFPRDIGYFKYDNYRDETDLLSNPTQGNIQIFGGKN